MSKLLKVVFEYDDHIWALEKEDAQEWQNEINDCIMSAFIHGIFMTQSDKGNKLGKKLERLKKLKLLNTNRKQKLIKLNARKR